jgi:hypothetical protein
METEEPGDQRTASDIREGDRVCFWADRYVRILKVRQESGIVHLTYLHPLTGLPTESEYEPSELVVAQRSDVQAARPPRHDA